MLSKANIAIALTLTVPALLQQSSAQTPSPEAVTNKPVAASSNLSDVTVSATRSARKVDDVPSSVSVITDATIQKEGARTLKDVFRNELDVTVPEQCAAAVAAAIVSPWSNGQTEGQITKLKLVKRQMYGRANLDLLRARLVVGA